jgi:hypothetical protein
MTGTPLDLTAFGGIVSGIGWLYWLFTFALLAIAIHQPKTPLRKVLWSLLVVGLFGVMPGMHARDVYVANAKLRAATARFDIRCKSAGERISRTVENVDGVVWMKWRGTRNREGQFRLDDPFGWECGNEDCIRLLLRATVGQEIDPQKRTRFHRGFAFVESLKPGDAQPSRYTMKLKSGNLDHQELILQPLERVTARYGVTWDDISTREDREMWIAGGSLKVVDLQSSEVIAERIGYMMDRGLGSTFNGRSPWLFAERSACPAFDEGHRGAEGRRFVHRVLQPTKGE